MHVLHGLRIGGWAHWWTACDCKVPWQADSWSHTVTSSHLARFNEFLKSALVSPELLVDWAWLESLIIPQGFLSVLSMTSFANELGSMKPNSARASQCRGNRDTKLRKVVTSWIGRRGLGRWASTATGQQMGPVLFVKSCHPKLKNNLVFGFCAKNFQKSVTVTTKQHYSRCR